MTELAAGKAARRPSSGTQEYRLENINGLIQWFSWLGNEGEYFLNTDDITATDWQIQNEDGTWESELVPLCRMAANRTETSCEPVVNPI